MNYTLTGLSKNSDLIQYTKLFRIADNTLIFGHKVSKRCIEPVEMTQRNTRTLSTPLGLCVLVAQKREGL